MDNLKLGVLFLYHPLKANVIVKRRREKFRPLPVLLLFLLAVAARIFSIYFTNYPVSTIRPEEANPVLEIAVVLLPVVTWVVSSYALTSIMGGSAMLGESLTGVAYSYLPYIVFTFLLTPLSHLVSYSGSGLFHAVQGLVIAWQVLLIFLSFKSLNDFSMRKALGVAFISILGIAVIWALLLLLFALTSQVFYFAGELMTEIRFLSQ